jgi:hypothetical protein
VLALGGTLAATCLVFTTYTRPIEGASADPALYDLIAAAVHAPSLPRLPRQGQSPLPIVNATPSDTGSTRLAPGGGTPAPSQSENWAETAAVTDSAALRDWLGSGVIAIRRVKAPDTLQLTLYRVSFRAGCPWVSRLVASSVGLYGKSPELVHVRATCPPESRPNARYP